jgi:thioredoxin-related protein
LGEIPVPVSEKNFQVYGVSTTPTLVLIDAAGVVRLYHPGKMNYEELAPRVAALVGS